MNYPRSHRLGGELLLSVLLLSGGCASWINPHILPEADTLDEFESKSYYGNLADSIKNANDLRDKYLKAVGDQSKLRNTIGLSIIPLSASALYLGFASSANAELAAGLGLGAGGLYSMGSYMTSTPRQRVWLEGSRALGCAVFAMRPLLVTQAEYDSFVGALDEIPLLQSKVGTEISTVQAMLDSFAELTPVERKEAEAAVAEGKSLSQQGDAYLRSGRSLKRQLEIAGLTLDMAVRNIATEVSKQILDTEQTLASLMSATANLGQLAGQFGHLGGALQVEGVGDDDAAEDVDGKPKAEAEETESDQLESAILVLKVSSSKLAAELNTVAASVNTATELAEAGGDIKACQVGTVARSFRLIPDVDSQEIAAGEKFVFSLIDESGVPQVQLSGEQDDAVTLDTDAKDGMVTATVSVAEAARNSLMSLIVKDGKGNVAKVVTIQIRAGKGGGEEMEKPQEVEPKTSGAKAWNTYLRGDEPEFIKTEQDAKAVQCALKFEDSKRDGKFGKETRAAIKAYQAAHAEELGLETTMEIELEDLVENAYTRLISENAACADD